jgi:hypothetical protein
MESGEMWGKVDDFVCFWMRINPHIGFGGIIRHKKRPVD